MVLKDKDKTLLDVNILISKSEKYLTNGFKTDGNNHFSFTMRKQKRMIMKTVQHSYQAQGGYKSLCVEMDYLWDEKPLLNKKILQG